MRLPDCAAAVQVGAVKHRCFFAAPRVVEESGVIAALCEGHYALWQVAKVELVPPTP